MLSVPAELIIYILVGFYLGIQKTNISSLLVIVMSVLNIVFSSFFVLSLNLNIFGVVLGTLIASYITAMVFSLFTYNFIIKKFITMKLYYIFSNVIQPVNYFTDFPSINCCI